MGSSADGIGKDRAAVLSAITSPWSSGQITQLKLVKRQMYDRAELDLLEAHLVRNASSMRCLISCTKTASKPVWTPFDILTEHA